MLLLEATPRPSFPNITVRGNGSNVSSKHRLFSSRFERHCKGLFFSLDVVGVVEIENGIDKLCRVGVQDFNLASNSSWTLEVSIS